MMELIRALIIGCLLISTATVAAAACADPYCRSCPNVNFCDVCQSSYFLNDKKGCTHCGTGCASCRTFGACAACQERYFLKSNSYCSQCPQFCTECTSYTSCSACKTGYYGAACGSVCQEHCVGGECTKDTCVRGCNNGYYKDTDNECKTCKNTCKTCSNGNSCDSCDIDRYGPTCLITCKSRCPDGACDISTGKCGITCAEDQYLDKDEHCSACTSPCKACVNTNTTCTRCESGYYLDGKICQQCLAACSTCTSKTRCTSCKQDYHLSTGQCYPCNLECKDQQCEPDGNCTNGCTSPEKFGTKCDKLCADELLNCSVCNTTTTVVKCALCKTGFHLESDNCVPNITCSSQCKNGTCDQDGNCTNGCSSRDRYGPTCDKRCSAAVEFCSECNSNGGPVICNACQTGYILHSRSCHLCPSNCNQGCVSGDDVITCKKDAQTAPDRTTSTEGTNTTTWIVIAVAVVIISILSVVVVIACVRIRKLQAVIYGKQKTDVQLEATDNSGHDQTDPRHPRPDTSTNPYMDLTPALGRDDHLYDTTHTGPHPRPGTRENGGQSSDGHQYINLTVE